MEQPGADVEGSFSRVLGTLSSSCCALTVKIGVEQPGADVEDRSSDEAGAHTKPDPPGLRVHGVRLEDADARRHAKGVGERIPARRQELVDGDGCGNAKSTRYNPGN